MTGEPESLLACFERMFESIRFTNPPGRSTDPIARMSPAAAAELRRELNCPAGHPINLFGVPVVEDETLPGLCTIFVLRS